MGLLDKVVAWARNSGYTVEFEHNVHAPPCELMTLFQRKESRII